MEAFFSLVSPSSLPSLGLGEDLILVLPVLLLLLRFSSPTLLYAAWISSRCSRSSSIYSGEKEAYQYYMEQETQMYIFTGSVSQKWKLTDCISCVYLLVISVNCASTSRYSLSNFDISALLVRIWASTALSFCFSSAKDATERASIV